MTALPRDLTKKKKVRATPLKKDGLYCFRGGAHSGFNHVLRSDFTLTTIYNGDYLLSLNETLRDDLDETIIWRKVFHLRSRQNIWTLAELSRLIRVK